VPLLTTFGPLGPLKNLHLIYYRGTTAILPQTCSSVLSEVRNESEEVMVIQPLSHISVHTFVHQREVIKTVLPVTPTCHKAWSKVRTILTESWEIPVTYIFYQMETNAKFKAGFVVLILCHTTASQMRPPRTQRGCQRDDSPAMPHSAPGSCSMLHTPRHASTQKASPTSGKHRKGWCPLPGILQWVRVWYGKLLLHFCTKRQTMTLTATYTSLAQPELL